MEQATEKSTFPESKLPTLSARTGRQRSGLPRPSLLPSSVRPESQLTVTEKADTEKSEKVVTTSMTSAHATNVSEEHDEWKRWIGQKVCIGTVKKGILRYFGETQFAEGLWCGVELTEAVGKNDGSVKGVRYFQCADNHGIFAPLSKIEKSLSSEGLQETSESIQQIPSKLQCPVVKSKLPPPKIILKPALPRNARNCFRENDDIPLHDTTFSKYPNSKGPMNETVITYKKRTNDISFTVPSKISRFSSIHHQVLENKEYEVKSNFFLSTTANNACFSNKVTLARKRSLPLNVSYSIRTHGQYMERATDDSKNTKDLLNRTVSLSEPVYCDNIFVRENEPLNLNATFSANHELPKEALNSTFSLMPPCEDGMNQVVEDKEDDVSEHNRTFTVDELQQMVRSCDSITSNLLHKYKGSDEDLVSYECDESLGILTPSQMKDFTVCTDNQPPLMEAANLIRIPKMESCDDINDIPEDEIIQNISPGFSPIEDIREVQGIFPGNGIHFDTTGTESSTSSSPENKFQEFLHDSLESPQSKIDDLTANISCSMKTSTPFNSSQNTTIKKVSYFAEEVLKYKENDALSRKIFHGGGCSPLKHHFYPEDSIHDLPLDIKINDKSICKSCEDLPKIVDEIKLDNESLPNCDLIDITVSAAQDEATQLADSKENVNNDIVDSLDEDKQDTLFENLPHEFKQITTGSENLQKTSCSSTAVTLNTTHDIQPLVFQEGKEKTSDIIELHSEQTVPRKEHPASSCTVGSSDTGFHGDGDFDNQSEGIATIESPCDENMKQSMIDSCIGTDYSHSERNQKSDIMTDSDFYTDSGGVGMTESEIELDGECKDLNRTFDKPFSALGDTDNQLDYINDSEKTLDNGPQESVCNEKNITITNEINKDLTENVLSSTFEIQKDISHEEVCTQVNMNATFKSVEQSANNVIDNLTDLRDKVETVVEKSNLTLNFTDSKIHEKDNDNRNILSKQKLQNAHSGKKNVSVNNLDTTKVIGWQASDNRTSVARTSKRNVTSKIKTMIETSKVAEKHEIKQTPRKNNKWDAVTSKIAASLADEKTKPKTRREIKSRIDTNLASRGSAAKKSPKLNSGSTSILTENDNSSNSFESGNKIVKNVLNSQRSLEGKENVQQFTFAEPPVFVQNNMNRTFGHGDGNSKPDKLPIIPKNLRKKRNESYPPSCPLSPGVKSDSSTVSLGSYDSKTSRHSSKIAILKSRKTSVGSIGALSHRLEPSKPAKHPTAKTTVLNAVSRKSFAIKAENLKSHSLP